MREAIRMHSEAISMPPRCASAKTEQLMREAIHGNQTSSVAINLDLNLEYLVRLELSFVTCRDGQCSLDLASLE